MAVAALEAFKNKLDCLSDFVADLKEENKEVSILTFNTVLEKAVLNKKIAELEETNRKMNCVGQSLREDIKQYQQSLARSTKRAETLRNRIVELEKSCSDMCDIERNLQKKIDKLTGPKWLQD